MRYIEKSGELELSNGRRIPLNMGVVGLVATGEGDNRVYTGRTGTLLFDVGGVGLSWERGEGHAMTRDERQELGNYMIEAWKKWRGAEVQTMGDVTPLSADPFRDPLAPVER